MINKIKIYLIFLQFLFCKGFAQIPALISSTEGDPDGFILNSVNVIKGDYCESVTDLKILGPDPFLLQRFYNSKNYLTALDTGGWRLFVTNFLVIGKDKKGLTHEGFDQTYAYTGERSGGILRFSGWTQNGKTEKPLKVDLESFRQGAVNTFSNDPSGKTSHINYEIHCEENLCKAVLGDGTIRLYEKVNALPSLILGEELFSQVLTFVTLPSCYRLIQEILPSQNILFFEYNSSGHLSRIEMQNCLKNKVLLWLNFKYEFNDGKAIVDISTSDEKTLRYVLDLFQLENGQETYVLSKVSGSHCVANHYEYFVQNNLCQLTKKTYPNGLYREISYDKQGLVKAILEPHPETGKPYIQYSFSFGKNFTEVFDALGIKTRYEFDDFFRLISIQKFDNNNSLHRKDIKFWGNSPENFGFLMVKAVCDPQENVHFHQSYLYDERGNVLEEVLSGSLTGRKTNFPTINPNGMLTNAEELENHKVIKKYSNDGFNLVLRIGDDPERYTRFDYIEETNLLAYEVVFDKGTKKTKEFSYNMDSVCFEIIETAPEQHEYHITYIKFKEDLPGVGLPLTVRKLGRDKLLLMQYRYSYDPQGNLLRIDTYDCDENFAYSEKREYNSLGQPILEINKKGQESYFTYDECGNLLTFEDPSKQTFIQNIYNCKKQLIQRIENIGEYRFTIAKSYNLLGNVESETDRYGNSTKYEYDAFQRLIKTTFPKVYNEKGQVIQPSIQYTHDLFGNISTLTDPLGFTTTYHSNIRGNFVQISYPDATTEWFRYDQGGSLIHSFSRDQVKTSYQNDYQGRVTKLIKQEFKKKNPAIFQSCEYEYNAFQCLRTKEGKQKTAKVLDAFGRVAILRTNSDQCYYGKNTEFQYDSLGRVKSRQILFGSADQDYSKQFFEYDLAGNLLENWTEDAKGTIHFKKSFIFDANDRCIEEYEYINGVKTPTCKKEYTALGEVKSYCDSQGNITKLHIDHFFCNDLNQQVVKKTITNPKGVQTEVEFDSLGRVVRLTKKDAFGTLLSDQKILYDVLGNKCAEINVPIAEGKDFPTKSTLFEYGPLGKLQQEIEDAGTANQRIKSFQYNPLGQLEVKNTPSQNSLVYTYNSAGDLAKVGTKDREVENIYHYDEQGNIIKAVNQSGTIERQYDSLNRLTQETISDQYGSYSVKFTYDRINRINTIILPDSSSILFSYNALNGKEVKRLSASGALLYSHKYDAYNEKGQPLEELLPGGIPIKHAYDVSGNEILLTTPHFSENALRDNCELINSIERKGLCHPGLSTFSYTDLGQLKSEKGPHFNHTYLYDSLDNRLKMDDIPFTYEGMHLDFQENTHYSYDPQGNLLRKSLDNEELHFVYNPFGELRQIKTNDTFLNCTYDAFGRRLSKKLIKGKPKNRTILYTQRFLYIGNEEIGLLDENGNLLELRVTGINPTINSFYSVAIELQGKPYAVLHDILGNINALIDPSTGKVVESYLYSAFGKMEIFDSNGNSIDESLLGNHWGYKEKHYDSETGLLFFGYRYYDPEIGRWITPDPLGTFDGPNLYSFVHNNPLNLTDRYGLETNHFPYTYEDGEYIWNCTTPELRYCIGYPIPVYQGKIQPLPKITYKDNYESQYPADQRSRIFHLGLQEEEDIGIGFINGVWNSFEDAWESANYISQLADGRNIHTVYNATHGRFTDLHECKIGLNFIATPPVRMLHEMWNNFFYKSNADSRFLMICHSQGAIHVRNALLDYPKELRERISVVAIAPAGYIYRQTCSQVIHYRVAPQRDFIPYLDLKGRIREKGQSIVLPSHPKASFFDHTFQSPTYRTELSTKITKFIESKGKKL